MNLTIQVLICDTNEDFRTLVREMLGKNGFFHVLESNEAAESVRLLRQEKKSFLITRTMMLNDELLGELKNKTEFLIVSQPEEDQTIAMASRFGVAHCLSFPFSSQTLGKRMSQFC